MASDFAIQSTESATSFDQRWLGSSHGLSNAETGTLDLTTLAASRDANGVLVSGIAVGEITASGEFGLFDAAAIDGREVLAGFILADVDIVDQSGGVQASNKAPFARLVHGIIRTEFLPIVAQRTITRTTATSGSFVLV